MRFWNNKDGIVIVLTPGGMFKKGDKYPCVNIDGYLYIILIPMDSLSKTLFVRMDCFEDYEHGSSYRVYGMGDDEENAVFVKGAM
jgi:hypothetical protein